MSTYKAGQVYYKLIDGWDMGGLRGEGRWHMASYRFLSETKNRVTVEHRESGRLIQINKPWKVQVSPWDAVDDKAAEMQRESRTIEQHARDHARNASEAIADIDRELSDLIAFRQDLTIDP